MRWNIGCWGRPGSNSARIAARIAQISGAKVIDFFSDPQAEMPRDLVILTPNHGDAEVQEDIEKFLVARGQEIQKWVIVEIGNYGGFDDWSFGARERIAMYLKRIGKGEEALPGVGIDTLPRIDWSTLDRWSLTVLKSEFANV